MGAVTAMRDFLTDFYLINRGGELQILKSQIMMAYDRCVFLYGVAK